MGPVVPACGRALSSSTTPPTPYDRFGFRPDGPTLNSPPTHRISQPRWIRRTGHAPHCQCRLRRGARRRDWLELDDGAQARLTRGDTVVQLGGRHAWRTRRTDRRLLSCLDGCLGHGTAVLTNMAPTGWYWQRPVPTVASRALAGGGWTRGAPRRPGLPLAPRPAGLADRTGPALVRPPVRSPDSYHSKRKPVNASCCKVLTSPHSACTHPSSRARRSAPSDLRRQVVQAALDTSGGLSEATIREALDHRRRTGEPYVRLTSPERVRLHLGELTIPRDVETLVIGGRDRGSHRRMRRDRGDRVADDLTVRSEVTRGSSCAGKRSDPEQGTPRLPIGSWFVPAWQVPTYRDSDPPIPRRHRDAGRHRRGHAVGIEHQIAYLSRHTGLRRPTYLHRISGRIRFARPTIPPRR